MNNVCGIDRVIRIIAGAFLISLVFFGEHIFGQNIVWGWIGIIPLFTGVFRFCPAYTLLGMKTCAEK